MYAILVSKDSSADGENGIYAKKFTLTFSNYYADGIFQGSRALFCLNRKLPVTFVVPVILANGKNRITESMPHKYQILSQTIHRYIHSLLHIL